MKLFLSTLLIVILIINVYPQKQLSLQEAIKIALQKNTTLLSRENDLKKGESAVDAAYGRFIPDLRASASWDWYRSEEAGRVSNINGANVNIPASTSESRSYGLGVSSNVVLFDGLANFANLSSSKNNLEAIKLTIEGAKQDVVFNTINLYYTIVESEQLLKVREENVKQQQKNLETIEERNRLGSVTMADVYQQQVQLGNAELDVIRQKNTLETAKSNLLYYLGLDVLENYTYTDSFTERELEILKTNVETDYNKIQELVNQALQTRRDYLSQKLNLESFYNDITSAKSGHIPRLTGNLGYGTAANSIDNLFDSQTYSAGLTLSIPIFSGFSVNNAVQIAEVNAMNYELQVRDSERLIKQDILKSFLDLDAAKKGITVTKKNLKAAEENLKIEQEKYNLGSGKLLDVLIANTALQNAKTDEINAQFFYIRRVEELKYNLGILDYSIYE
jgi:outer membrane protein